MLIICSVTDTLSTQAISKPQSMEPGSFNFSQISACVIGIGVLGPHFIVFSKEAAQIVAPKGIQTQHLLYARQALYH